MDQNKMLKLKYTFTVLAFSLICVNTALARCTDGKNSCEWIPWKPWSECSRTCGGGIRYRSRDLCCKTSWSFTECLNNCGLENNAYDSETCNGICYNGGIFSSRCSCTDAFYGFCCQTDCPAISECKRRSCTASYNVICKECNNDNVFFKRYNMDKECQRMCSWNNHYCWPGNCSADGLSKDCTCTTGFRKIATAGETSCQPIKAPSISICDTVAIGPNGEKKRAMSSTSSTACQYLQDIYGNYQLSVLQFDLVTVYTLNMSSSSRPSFIVEQNFGITDTTIYIKRQSVSGIFATLSTERQLADINSSQSVTSAHQDSGNLTVTASIYKLKNGEALCLEFEAKGGGYLKAKDTRTTTHTVLNAKPFHKTTEQRKVCYRYDSQPPEHCSKQSTCTYEPLQLNERITRSSVHNVKFNGWMDPVPPGGALRTISSIESYEIRVNEVLPSERVLKVDYTNNVVRTNVNRTVSIMELNLASDTPRLYCLTLEVKDVADNVRQCRRFILYDNTSSIQVWNEKPFRFTSASPATNYTWQNDHNDICISWKDYFYNDFYIHNELLNPIESDPHGLMTGSYDQINGEIPVSGTSNVHGIIAFYVSWSLNHGSFSADKPVPTFTNQSFCKDLNVKDGHIYTLNVKAIDIAGNTLTDNRSVFIDRSAPHLSDIWLEKDGYEMLFVHSSTDLSKMKITFHAFDKHSGIVFAAWIFGCAKSDKELVSWQIGGQKVTEICDNEQDDKCYCPQIGHCEVSKYYVDLAEYMKDHKIIGEQNKEYFFNISVKNTAGLISEKGITIAVDETPPQLGNLSIEQSNSNGTNDTERYIVAHWLGFSDPESGIRSYRISINNRCLVKEEMYSFSKTTKSALFFELSFNETSKVMFDNFTCTPYITVIALNNALLPSSAICIEGITQPDRDSCKTVMHDEDKTVLAVSLSTSGALAVIIGATVVVVYLVMKRRRSKSDARKEFRVSHHKENVSFERNEQEYDIAHLPYSDSGNAIEENPYESPQEFEGERISSVDNATYMNLQLKSS